MVAGSRPRRSGGSGLRVRVEQGAGPAGERSAPADPQTPESGPQEIEPSSAIQYRGLGWSSFRVKPVELRAVGPQPAWRPSPATPGDAERVAPRAADRPATGRAAASPRA